MRALAIIVLLAGVAGAEPAQDAITVALFNDGKDLAARGAYERACAKFEAAHARATWLGIELNLADCYEHLGKTASAWVLYRRAADAADRASDSRAAFAREAAARLEPKLARVVIESAVDVKLDGASIVANTTMPLDPGPHAIEASAPDRVTWSMTFTAVAAKTVALRVPSLAHVPHRRAQLAIGGIGAVSLAASIALAIDAKHRYDAALVHCTPNLACDPTGVDAIAVARRRGNLATAIGVAGIAAIAGAAMFYAFDRDDITPVVEPQFVGVALRGSL
jgi:hypothetical protein